MKMEDIKNISQCYVFVRKLSMQEISRISISPFLVTHKCARCGKRTGYGPQCMTCQKYYHYHCAALRNICCNEQLLPSALKPATPCPRCKETVDFGPQCSVCLTKFHNYCVSPYDHCCQLNLCERKKFPDRCGKCLEPVEFGPKCPLCNTVYHADCAVKRTECCGVKFTRDEDIVCRCKRCKRKLALASPMCTFCGRLSHGYCVNKQKKCCGKRVPLEVYLVPSFKFLANFYLQFDRRREMLRKLEEAKLAHGRYLRSSDKESDEERRTKQKAAGSQTHVLDSIEIVDVKTEVEQKDLDITDTPPLLEREDFNASPEPSSSFHEPASENDDTLKNLFDFLYKMVKKFPPSVQTQVKIDLFKVVTEAEMKCNMGQ